MSILGGAMGADLALGAGQMASPVLDNLTHDALGEEIHDEGKRREEQLLAMLKSRRLDQMRADNLARVAQLRPDLYNQVAVGRRLPRGAVVIGGKPDTEALARLGDMMARGG